MRRVEAIFDKRKAIGGSGQIAAGMGTILATVGASYLACKDSGIKAFPLTYIALAIFSLVAVIKGAMSVVRGLDNVVNNM